MLAEPMPKGWRLTVERNPWKRLFEWWAWTSYLGAIVCGIAVGVNLARASSRTGRAADRAEDLAVLWGFSTAGLFVSALVMATISWALHRYRTTIRIDYPAEDEQRPAERWPGLRLGIRDDAERLPC